jgi:hypothetical protein
VTTANLNLLAPANYARLLKAELKDSAGAAVPLRYVYEREADGKKQDAVIFIGEVGAGMVSLMKKVEDHKVLIGTVAETEKEILFEIGSQLTDKALTVQLLDVSIRKPVRRVKDVAAELIALSAPAPAADVMQAKLGEKAAEKIKSLEGRLAPALKRADENVRQRLAGQVSAYEEAIKHPRATDWGKQAAEAAVQAEKLVELIEQQHHQQRHLQLERVARLIKRRDALKNPPLHPKHLKTFSDTVDGVVRGVDEVAVIDWNALSTKLDSVESLLDEAEDLHVVFTGQQREQQDLAKSVTLIDALAVSKAGGKEKLTELIKALQGVSKKLPDTLLIAKDYNPFGEVIEAQSKLIKFVRDILKPKTPPNLTTPEGRKAVYAYDDPTTWVMNAVDYKNGTASARIETTIINNLAAGQLRSNTTAGGSVLKVGFEGHTHINGGSGGMAFVYKLESDWTVTPTVVDVAYARGNGSDKNKYAWETGPSGQTYYFPPNASY